MGVASIRSISATARKRSWRNTCEEAGIPGTRWGAGSFGESSIRWVKTPFKQRGLWGFLWHIQICHKNLAVFLGVIPRSETAPSLGHSCGSCANYPDLMERLIDPVQKIFRPCKGCLLKVPMMPVFHRVQGWLMQNIGALGISACERSSSTKTRRSWQRLRRVYSNSGLTPYRFDQIQAP